MTIHVDKDWWKHLFDDIYLQTDARSVCNEQLTEWEVDFLEQVLDAEKKAPILDLCGGAGAPLSGAYPAGVHEDYRS